MNKPSIVLLFSLVSGLGFGCKDDAGKTGAVGIVDLQKVANTMGWSEEMRRNAQESQKKCRDEVDAYLLPFREVYEHKRDELAKEARLLPAQIAEMKKATQPADLEKLGLTKAQVDELTRLAQAYGAESNAASTRMNQAMQSQQQALVVACTHAAEPAIRRVAATNHCSVVLTPGGTLLYSDPTAELTDKVIDDLQHSTQMKVAFPEPPHLDLHPQPPAATQPRQ